MEAREQEEKQTKTVRRKGEKERERANSWRERGADTLQGQEHKEEGRGLTGSISPTRMCFSNSSVPCVCLRNVAIVIRLVSAPGPKASGDFILHISFKRFPLAERRGQVSPLVKIL